MTLRPPTKWGDLAPLLHWIFDLFALLCGVEGRRPGAVGGRCLSRQRRGVVAGCAGGSARTRLSRGCDTAADCRPINGCWPDVAGGSRQPIVADRGRRRPMGGGPGACRASGRTDDHPDQLRLSDGNLVVADGSAVAGWYDRPSPTSRRCDSDSGLEAFLAEAGLDRAGQSSQQIRSAFGSLTEALNAEPLALEAIGGAHAARILKAAHKLHVDILAEALIERRYVTNQQDVAAFLAQCIGHRPIEALVILHLDGRRRIICHDLLAEGQVDAVPIDNRRIILRALERGSKGLILAHNHPSGDGRPSDADLRATRQVIDCARLFDIALHDHLIVTGAKITSLRALHLI